MSDRAGENELSRLIALDDLGRDGVALEITADAHERAALAERFDLVAVDSLTATVTLKRDEADQMVQLRGNLSAEVVQSCVITLEPVPGHVDGVVEVIYSADENGGWAVRDMAPDADIAPGEDDLPELLEGDEIDIGEVVAEHFGLNLNPYPRRPGVVFCDEEGTAQDDAHDDADDENPDRASPFAVLRDFKTD